MQAAIQPNHQTHIFARPLQYNSKSTAYILQIHSHPRSKSWLQLGVASEPSTKYDQSSTLSLCYSLFTKQGNRSCQAVLQLDPGVALHLLLLHLLRRAIGIVVGVLVMAQCRFVWICTVPIASAARTPTLAPVTSCSMKTIWLLWIDSRDEWIA